MGVALSLFLLSPITLIAWAAGQALLRVTGIRWWKLALASLGSLAGVIVLQGGPSAALERRSGIDRFRPSRGASGASA